MTKLRTKQEMIDYYNEQIAICYKAKQNAKKPYVYWDRIRMFEQEIRDIQKINEKQLRLG